MIKNFQDNNLIRKLNTLTLFSKKINKAVVENQILKILSKKIYRAVKILVRTRFLLVILRSLNNGIMQVFTREIVSMGKSATERNQTYAVIDEPYCVNFCEEANKGRMN